jgi:hypothetical protein
MIGRFFSIVLAVLVGTVALAGAQSPPAPAPVASPRVSPAPEPSTAPSAAISVPHLSATLPPGLAGLLAGQPATQTYAAFTKGATHQAGVIDLLRKDDDLYLDLAPANFDHTYVILPSIERGVGSGAFAGRVYDPIVITFKRVGKRVLWISPNTNYLADKGSSAAQSLAVSVGDSVLLSTPILAESPDKSHVVVAPTLFLSDFESIGAELGHGNGPSLPGLLIISTHASVAVDPSKSYYGTTKTFPRNDEISVNLAFNGPPDALSTVPDGRGIPIVMHYSIVAPPERDPRFVPRYADDRVGYFITAHKRYGDDSLTTPFERFIDRWNLDDGPITFYLTNEIPQEYRATVRRGILAWNEAFAKAGRPNAIVVKDQPTDPSWDPDDARYSTVRWILSDEPNSFAAYSPHVSDPDTGQIIRATVVIDGEAMRTIKRGFVDRVAPAQRASLAAYADPEHAAALLADATIDENACTEQETGAAQAALGTLMLAQGGHATAAAREHYAQAWLYNTVMHEVGHTLGLRHNFEGSTAYSYRDLHDPAFTRAHGTTASVMDYTPANLAAPSERQADYFPTKLGVYDEWAIEYGYEAFPNIRSSADERIPLSRIAARSTQPGLAYGTDEDATANGIDPRIARFDLSSDPLAYDAEQLRIDDDVATHLLHRYSGDVRSYQEIRSQLITVLNNQLGAALLAGKYIGGIETTRAHRGEPGGALPFTPIARAQQRRAFDLIDRWILSSRALRFSPELLNAVAPSRYGLHWGVDSIARPDFPIREVIGEVQDDVIGEIFSPANLARIGDTELKVAHPSDTMTLADLFAWTNASIYDDLGRPAIDPSHRELQLRFAALQMEIAALPVTFVDLLGLPRETQSLARYNLMKLDARLDGAIAAARDEGTAAHLVDLRSRVRGLLRAQNVRAI